MEAQPFWEQAGSGRWIYRTAASPEPLGVVFVDGWINWEWYVCGTSLQGRNWSLRRAKALVEKQLALLRSKSA